MWNIVVGYHQRVAWGIHAIHRAWVEIERDPQEKSSFGTNNPSLLVRAGWGWGVGILEKGRGAMKGMSWVR
jgi:hypothetical protein